jgi:looped-hinge helix DNA binding domain, AbrB family
MLSTVTSKGQVTIPKQIRDALKINSSDKVDFSCEGQKIILVPVKILKDFRGVVKTKGAGVFSKERAKAKAAVAKRVLEQAS